MPRNLQVEPTGVYPAIAYGDIEPGMVICYMRDRNNRSLYGREIRYGKVTGLEAPNRVWATWADDIGTAKIRFAESPEESLFIVCDSYEKTYLVEGAIKPKAGLSQFLEKHNDITRAVS